MGCEQGSGLALIEPPRHRGHTEKEKGRIAYYSVAVHSPSALCDLCVSVVQ